jgi:hypothetical protein
MQDYNRTSSQCSWNFSGYSIELQYSFLVWFPSLFQTGFVVSKTKKIQRLSKIFAANLQRLFKDLQEQSAVEKLQV